MRSDFKNMPKIHVEMAISLWVKAQNPDVNDRLVAIQGMQFQSIRWLISKYIGHNLTSE
jgi:hypothetical protein